MWNHMNFIKGVEKDHSFKIQDYFFASKNCIRGKLCMDTFSKNCLMVCRAEDSLDSQYMRKYDTAGEQK